jgi:hypothetical protein
VTTTTITPPTVKMRDRGVEVVELHDLAADPP